MNQEHHINQFCFNCKSTGTQPDLRFPYTTRTTSLSSLFSRLQNQKSKTVGILYFPVPIPRSQTQ
ncbi:hypothetical protein Hanom_Chr01g00082801 [Helianthus anomalus]